MRITISSDEGEVYLSHQITSPHAAQFVLQELRPGNYALPDLSEAELTELAGEHGDFAGDLCEALESLAGIRE